MSYPHMGKMRQDPTGAGKTTLCYSQLFFLEPMAFQESLTHPIPTNGQETEKKGNEHLMGNYCVPDTILGPLTPII